MNQAGEVSAYDRLVWPEGQVEKWLVSGEHRRELLTYFGDAEYARLRDLALVAALMTPPARDKMRSDFLFMLLLGHMLPPSHLLRLVDQRIAWYRDSLAHMESCDLSGRPPSVRLVNGLGLAVYRAAADYLEANRHLIADERATPSTMVAE